jgi:hypothetical protein
LKYVGEFDNTLGNVFDFAFALRNEGGVWVMGESFLSGLLERGLRE